MTGVSRSPSCPSLAVGFAMIASFFLSSRWPRARSGGWKEARTARGTTPVATGSSACARGSAVLLHRVAPARGLLVVTYLVVTVGVVVAIGMTPAARSSTERRRRFQLGSVRPQGQNSSRPSAWAATSWTSSAIRQAGQCRHHSRIRRRAALVAPDQHDLPLDQRLARRRAAGRAQARCTGAAEALQEKLRHAFHGKFPDAQFSLSPVTSSAGSRTCAPTPVEVAVMGPDFAASRAFATKARNELSQIGSLRDLQFGQTLDYPAIQVNVNRQMAGQLGVTVDQVGRSFAAATSSSRLSRRTTGRTLAPASPSRCRCRCHSHG